IESPPGHGDGEAGEERGHPRDISVVLPRLVRAAEVDLLHDRRVEARTTHDLADDERCQVVRPDVFQVADMSPHRSPDGSHDDRFRHSASPNDRPHSVVGFGLRGGPFPGSLETVSHTSHRKSEVRGKYTST